MNLEFSNFSTILFDAAGTLFELRESVGQGYAKVATEFDLELCPDLTELAFRKHFRAMPSPYPSESTDPEQDWWSELVDRVLMEQQIETPGGFFTALWEHYAAASTWKLFPEVPEVLSTLQEKNIQMILVTNFDERIFPILSGLEVIDYFGDDVVTSASARCRKPESAIFQQAVAKSSNGPILHVGDERKADWEGARAAGIEAFELERPKNCLRDLIRTQQTEG